MQITFHSHWSKFQCLRPYGSSTFYNRETALCSQLKGALCSAISISSLVWRCGSSTMFRPDKQPRDRPLGKLRFGKTFPSFSKCGTLFRRLDFPKLGSQNTKDFAIFSQDAQNEFSPSSTRDLPYSRSLFQNQLSLLLRLIRVFKASCTVSADSVVFVVALPSSRSSPNKNQDGHGMYHRFPGYSRCRAKLSRGPKGIPMCLTTSPGKSQGAPARSEPVVVRRQGKEKGDLRSPRALSTVSISPASAMALVRHTGSHRIHVAHPHQNFK